MRGIYFYRFINYVRLIDSSPRYITYPCFKKAQLNHNSGSTFSKLSRTFTTETDTQVKSV